MTLLLTDRKDEPPRETPLSPPTPATGTVAAPTAGGKVEFPERNPECEHHFLFLRERPEYGKLPISVGPFYLAPIPKSMFDVFYCTKCLERKEVKRW